MAGKWYYPKEDKGYKKVGAASWYGDAFHGRLTANGEIYDMTHLTAAHPTMPLPSYARVTNTVNGSSVIVRVNDRGPYARGRIIDLSKRAAELLDYTHSGTARVKVEYVGRAPLDGHDDRYLMASYHPGNRAPDPSDGLPAGVMIAMNGPTPSLGVGHAAAAFPGVVSDAKPTLTAAVASPQSVDFDLPAFGPIAPERPLAGGGPAATQVALATMSYAEERLPSAARAFAALERPLSEAPAEATAMPYVAAGSFALGGRGAGARQGAFRGWAGDRRGVGGERPDLVHGQRLSRRAARHRRRPGSGLGPWRARCHHRPRLGSGLGSSDRAG